VLLQFQHLYTAEEVFLSYKELGDLELATKAMKNDVIKILEAPFEESIKLEVNLLIASGGI